MNIRPMTVLLTTFALVALGCASETEADPSGALILEGTAECDPAASAFDDLFIFEIETVEDVDRVEVDVYVGADLTGTVRLTERSAGNWYGEEVADDLDSDCDAFQSMLFEIIAEKGSIEDTRDINPD